MKHIAIQRIAADVLLPWAWTVTDPASDFYAYSDGENETFEQARDAALTAFREMIEERDVLITRDNQQTDTIYVGICNSFGFKNLTIFVTPDGLGRYYYASVADARRDMGEDLPVRYVARIED